MAEQFEGGVRRAAEMVDQLTGDTRSLLGQMASQLDATIARNEQLRDGLVAQVERLEELLAYQRGQLSGLRAAADGVPHHEAATTAGAPATDETAVDLSIDPGDTSAGYGERVLRLLAEEQQATIDRLVERLVEAGDSDATRRKVSTAVTNLRRTGRVEREDDLVRFLG